MADTEDTTTATLDGADAAMVTALRDAARRCERDIGKASYEADLLRKKHREQAQVLIAKQRAELAKLEETRLKAVEAYQIADAKFATVLGEICSRYGIDLSDTTQDWDWDEDTLTWTRMEPKHG